MRFILPLFAAFILALAVYIAMHRVKPAEIAVTPAAAPLCIAPSSHYLWKQRRIA